MIGGAEMERCDDLDARSGEVERYISTAYESNEVNEQAQSFPAGHTSSITLIQMKTNGPGYCHDWQNPYTVA